MQPPEKIFRWWETNLSIARFYGGISYNGAQYVIDPSQEGSPLVRLDIFKRNQPDTKKATKRKGGKF